MPHAERPGAESGDGAAGPERLGRDLGAVKGFERVAEGIDESDQRLDAARIGERFRQALDAHARGLEPRRQTVERRGVRDLPAEKSRPLGRASLDQEPLAAVVHAQAQRRGGAFHELHAQKGLAEARPILKIAGAQPDVAKRLQFHFRLLLGGACRCGGPFTAFARFR